MENDDILLPVYVRPLGISALDEPMPSNVSHEQGDVVLRFLGDMLNDRNNPLQAARQRYQEVMQKVGNLPVAPMLEIIMRHVIAPLNEAIRCYVLGMPVACIAQAGLVGEMVALWRFRMTEPKLDGRPLSDELQKLLMGSTFDKLGQEKRIRVLQAIDSLNKEMVDTFLALKNIRNNYLHFIVDDPHRDVNKDACDAVMHASTLVSNTLNITFSDGRLVLPEKVMLFVKNSLKSSANPQGDEDGRRKS